MTADIPVCQNATMLQFRLRTLFIATTASAAMFWVLFVPPQWLGVLAIYLVYLLLPALTVSGIVFHRGYRQAFFIGMAPWIVVASFWFAFTSLQAWWPSGPWWDPFDEFLFTADSESLIAHKLLLVVTLIFPAASGLVGVGIRRWALAVERRND